jgi:hypothetical protein
MIITDYRQDALALEVQQRTANSLEDATEIARKLLAFAPELSDDLQAYWDHGTIPATAIEGWTVARLTAEYDMTSLAALLTLDWLAREPKRAAHALACGYDEIVF